VRLYHFTYPVADWHSWRQADTSAVSRNFVKYGFDVLHPKFDDLSNVPSGIDNPNGYRFVEFPVYNLFQAGLYSAFGFLTIEEWGRLVTIFSSLASIVFLYLLLTKYANSGVGLLAAFFYAVLPYNIYYSRVILPDPMMVTAVLVGIYFFDKWVEESSKLKVQNSKVKSKNRMYLYFILSILFTSSAFLLKPYAVFFVIPMFYIAWQEWGIRVAMKWQLWLFAIISLTPIIFWRYWITQYPEGVPSNIWLLNGNGIRFRPSFFRWIFYERLTKLISGYFGVVILFLGALASLRYKHVGFYLSFLLGSLLYVTVFATGNVQHDYYQILIMPTIAIFYGLGAYYLIKELRFGASFRLGTILFLLLTILTSYFASKEVKGYYYINKPEIVEAGKITDQMTPKEAKVIALYGGDTSFLYQTNRPGWASFQNPLPEMIEKGATHLVQVDPTPGDITLYDTKYEIMASTSAYVLVKLR
jgi:hypothetical protein